jgi:uncharacterized membrane protein YraQ (UPF0718 family)
MFRLYAVGDLSNRAKEPFVLKIQQPVFTVRVQIRIPAKRTMPPRHEFRVILRRSMDASIVVMIAAAVVPLVVVYWKSPQATSDGLSATGSLIVETIPRMVAAFTLAGLIPAVVPQETIVRWMGQGSGGRGY